LNALKVESGWVESPLAIRQAIVTHFANLFCPSFWHRPRLDGILFPCISEINNCYLSSSFAQDELDKVVLECDGNESPGPDSYNFSFIKEFWYLIKGEVKFMFYQFHVNVSLPKSFSSYFVALIPKIKSPFGLDEFRPISLLGCLYKLIVKVLAARLASVMSSIVAQTHRLFLRVGYLLTEF
jgi:hypothetical protein